MATFTTYTKAELDAHRAADAATYVSGAAVRNLVSLTRGDYEALPTKDPGTLYLVTGGVATGGNAPASALVDDFTGTSGLWQLVHGAATVTGGNLDLTPEFSGDASAYTLYQTVSSYDLTGSSVAFRVAQVPTGNDSGDLDFYFGEAPNQNALHFGWELGTLYFDVYNGTTATSIGTHAVSIASTPWWRLRHDGTTIVFEVSADSVTYTQLASVPASAVAWPLTSGRVIFNVGYYDNGRPAPVHALVAGVNAS